MFMTVTSRPGIKNIRKEDGATGVFVLGVVMMFLALTLAMIMFTVSRVSAMRSHLSAVVEAGVEAAALRIDAQKWVQENKVELLPDAGDKFFEFVARNLNVTSACLRAGSCVVGPGVLEGPVRASVRFRGQNRIEGTIQARFRLQLPAVIPAARLLEVPVEVTYQSQPKVCRSSGVCL